KLLPLLKGQMILPEITLNRPNVDMLRQASGRANWEDEADSKTPTHLPVINRFTVSVGNIKLTDDKRKLSFNGKFSAEELQNGAHSLAITGDGALNKKPFKLEVSGGPLINAKPGEPYPFDADIKAGDTHVLAKGRIEKPFDLGAFSADLNVTG